MLTLSSLWKTAGSDFQKASCWKIEGISFRVVLKVGVPRWANETILLDTSIMLARTSSRVVWSTVDRIGLKSSKIKLLNFITTVHHVDRTLTPKPVLSFSSLRKFVSRYYFIRAAALPNQANIGCSVKLKNYCNSLSTFRRYVKLITQGFCLLARMNFRL